jgi:hypothetical protein
MVAVRHALALCAVGGFLGLVWLGLYAELEGFERLADFLDPGYHWQVIRALVGMPLVWALAALATLGCAWTFAEAPGQPPPSPPHRP